MSRGNSNVWKRKLMILINVILERPQRFQNLGYWLFLLFSSQVCYLPQLVSRYLEKLIDEIQVGLTTDKAISFKFLKPYIRMSSFKKKGLE